jgi:hypothetical protein
VILLTFCLYGVWLGVWPFFREYFVMFGCLMGLVFWFCFMRFSRLMFVRWVSIVLWCDFCLFWYCGLVWYFCVLGILFLCVIGLCLEGRGVFWWYSWVVARPLGRAPFKEIGVLGCD